MTVNVKGAVGFMKRHTLSIISFSIALIAVLSVCAVFLLMPTDGVIAQGVSMNGVKLGGMTVEEASIIINQSGFFQNDFTIVCGSEHTTVSPSDIDLEVDEYKSALKAYGVGRCDNLLKKFAENLRLLTIGIDITPEPTLTPEKLETLLYDMGVKINGQHKSIEIEDISDTEVCVYPAIAGQDTNVSAVYDTVIDALSCGQYQNIEVTFNKTEEKPTAQQVYDMIAIEKQNAGYDVKDGEIVIFDEIYGRCADKDEISQKLPSLNSGEQIVLNVTRTAPEITKDMLDSELFGSELASFKSTYSTKAVNRAFNVNRAANSCNGRILLPNEVFSYCEAIGNPSLANGYRVAPVFANGKHSEGVGGGVCQVSSTIYSAVLYANLEIVERRSHSLPVSYVPKGQDATIAFGSQDFKFKNNTDKPIKIIVNATGGVCKVTILGSKPEANRKVEILNSIVSVKQPTDNITYDDTLPEGTRKIVEKGSTGYVVDSQRKVFENGKLVKTEALTRSSYQMVPNEVIVGTKVIEPQTPEPEPAPDNENDVPDTPPDVIEDATPVLADTAEETEV